MDAAATSISSFLPIPARLLLRLPEGLLGLGRAGKSSWRRHWPNHSECCQGLSSSPRNHEWRVTLMMRILPLQRETFSRYKITPCGTNEVHLFLKKPKPWRGSHSLLNCHSSHKLVRQGFLYPSIPSIWLLLLRRSRDARHLWQDVLNNVVLLWRVTGRFVNPSQWSLDAARHDEYEIFQHLKCPDNLVLCHYNGDVGSWVPCRWRLSSTLPTSICLPCWQCAVNKYCPTLSWCQTWAALWA